MPYKLSDFKILQLIGNGTFGKVYLVLDTRTEQLFAMKSIRKDIVIKTQAIECLSAEKMVLLKVNHPFLINMEHVFVMDTRIYFIMKYV